MKEILNDYKKFATKGNIIDMATGVVIGTAFTKIVNSLVSEIITPLLTTFTNNIDFTRLFISLSKQQFDTVEAAKAAGIATINYGVFITAIIDFLVISFVIFMFLRYKDRISKKFDKKTEIVKEATEKDCPFCLTSIPIKATRCPHCTSILEEPKENTEVNNIEPLETN